MINEQINKSHNKLGGASRAKANLSGVIFFALCVIVVLVIFSLFFSDLFSDKNTAPAPKKELNTQITNKDFIQIDLEKKPDEEKTIELNTTDMPKSIEPIKEVKIIKRGAVMGRAANVLSSQYSNNTEQKEGQTKAQIKEGQSGEVFAPTAAYFSPFDQNLLLAKGTYIGCSLKTRLVSDIKGGIACVVSNNVYSNNGKTLLIEKGSVVTGTYSGGSVEEGHERIYVIWQEIRTPNNIVIPVFSGASDELGGAGLEGFVDNHYFRRFGSAILVSIIDQGVNALSSHLERKKNNNNENSTTINGNGVNKTSDLAKKTLDKMIDIKPTLYKNQGDIVGIYVNRDVDFRNVYKLQKR